MQKYIDDFVETQNNIDLNDLDEEGKEARVEIDRDVYNNIVNQIKPN